MMAVTFIPRFLPMAWLSRIKTPAWLQVWLSYIPIGILAALLSKSLFVTKTGINLNPWRPEVLVLIPGIWVGAKTKKLFLPVLVGIGGVALLRLFM